MQPASPQSDFPLRSRLPRPRCGRDAARAFSLVELLTVMAIISLLTAFAVGSMQSIQASKLTGSGNQIADLMTLARQTAISKSTYTVVIIKTQSTGAYSAFCVLELPRLDDGSFGAWKAFAPWRYLPNGIFFCPNSQTGDNFLSVSGSLPQALPAQYPFQGQQVDLSTGAIFQVFQPDGTLSIGQLKRLRLVEGTVDAVSGQTTYTHPGSNGQPANFYDVLFLRDTGLTRVERL